MSTRARCEFQEFCRRFRRLYRHCPCPVHGVKERTWPGLVRAVSRRRQPPKGASRSPAGISWRLHLTPLPYRKKKLDWCGLNDRETRSDFDDPLHAKPCICQQGRELIRCAFLSVRGHEHVQIRGFRLKAVIRTSDDPFHDQKPSFWTKYPSACCQDRERG